MRNILLMVLLAMMNICRNFLWLIPSSLMSPIMEELGLNYTQAGYMLMIVTVMMGVFLIAGSGLLSYISPVTAMTIGFLCLACDGACSLFGTSFIVIMAGRVISGIGYGLCTCASTALIAASFAPESLGWINGINGCISSVTINLAYRFIVPISVVLGSWKREAGAFAAASIVCALLFLLWYLIKGRLLSFGKADKETRAGNIGSALKYPVIRNYIIIISSVMLLYIYFSSYYPNYLNMAHGFPLDKSSELAGYMSISGIAGSLGLGVLYTRIKHQKAFSAVMLAVIVLGYFGMTLLTKEAALIPAICVFGAAVTALSTFFSTNIMRLPGITPLAASAGVSLMTACGSLLALVVPAIQDALASGIGLQMTLIVFGVLFIPAVISLIRLPKS